MYWLHLKLDKNVNMTINWQAHFTQNLPPSLIVYPPDCCNCKEWLVLVAARCKCVQLGIPGTPTAHSNPLLPQLANSHHTYYLVALVVELLHLRFNNLSESLHQLPTRFWIIFFIPQIRVQRLIKNFIHFASFKLLVGLQSVRVLVFLPWSLLGGLRPRLLCQRHSAAIRLALLEHVLVEAGLRKQTGVLRKLQLLSRNDFLCLCFSHLALLLLASAARCSCPQYACSWARPPKWRFQGDEHT